jgi:hypothetical protein
LARLSFCLWLVLACLPCLCWLACHAYIASLAIVVFTCCACVSVTCRVCSLCFVGRVRLCLLAVSYVLTWHDFFLLACHLVLACFLACHA